MVQFLVITLVMLLGFLLIQQGYNLAKEIAFCRIAKILSDYYDEIGNEVNAPFHRLVIKFEALYKEDKNFIRVMFDHTKEHLDDHH